MALSPEQIESVAKAYRIGIYGGAGAGWENCKLNWIRDAKQFIKLLADFGLEIVEIKQPKPPPKI